MTIINDSKCCNQRRQPCGILIVSFPAMVIAVLLAGCGPEKGDTKGSPTKESSATGAAIEDQARAKLKTALDCWLFGDDEAKLKQDHPEIQFIDTDWLYGRGSKLLKYDIGTGRKFGRGYEFAVGLSFQSKAGTEIKETRPYSVTKNDKGEWTIMKTPR
jgi:hypothetical protein